MMLTDRRPELNTLRWREIVLFAVLAGTAATFVLGYYYGKSWQPARGAGLTQLRRSRDD